MTAPLIRAETLDEAMAQVGLPMPHGFEAWPDRIGRFDDPEGSRGNDAAWVIPFCDGLGAVFGNFRTDQEFTWQKTRDRALTKTEAQAFRQQVEASRKAAQTAREDAYREAAEKARQQWEAAVPATDHSYLSRKAVGAHGTRQDDTILYVPIYGLGGALRSLQRITPDGTKRFLPGGETKGGRFWIGEPGPAIVLAEGFATAAAIHEATGLPVCITFSIGNLMGVAKDVRKSHPGARLILAADNDIKADGPNVGYQKAQEASQAVSGTVALPDLGGKKCDWWDVRHEQGDKAIRAVFEPLARPRFKLLRRDDLRNLPELEWRVDGVLPMSGIGLVIGQSGAGKSFVVLDLLARVGLGLPWFGHDTRPCHTVYVGLEGRAGIKRRIEAWEAQNGRQVPDGFAVVLDSLKLVEDADIHELARAILEAGGQGALIVVDTLAQASPGIDENSSQDMGLVIAGLQRLQSLTGGLVLGVHHMGKDTTRGARGHSSLYAACDAVLAVTAGPQGHSVNTAAGDGGKSKDAEPISHTFDLARVVLRTLDDGAEITGAAVVEHEYVAVKDLPKVPQGGNQRIVWDALGAEFRKAGDGRPQGAPTELPDGRPAVRLEDVIESLAAGLTCEPKRKVERARSALAALINRDLIRQVEGWIWCK